MLLNRLKLTAMCWLALVATGDGVPEPPGGRASPCGPGCSTDSGSGEVARPGRESDLENGR